MSRRAAPDVVYSTMGQSSLSDLALGKPYRYRGDSSWTPGDPRFRESETRRPGPPPGHPNSAGMKAERFARFCEARASGASVRDAGTAAGIAEKTARTYEQERKQQRGAS